MTHPYLSEEQGARADALGVAHSLLSGTQGKPLTAFSRDGLDSDDLPHAVLLAQYVLTGRYAAPEDDDPDAEDLETIAGATGSTEAGYL